MFVKSVLDMTSVIELLQLSNLSLQVEPHQVHKFYMIKFVSMKIRIKRVAAQIDKFLKSKETYITNVHSPYMDVAVTDDSTAA